MSVAIELVGQYAIHLFSYYAGWHGHSSTRNKCVGFLHVNMTKVKYHAVRIFFLGLTVKQEYGLKIVLNFNDVKYVLKIQMPSLMIRRKCFFSHCREVPIPTQGLC